MIDPLEFTVFYQDRVYGKNGRETTVRVVLTEIVKGKYKTYIAHLRDLISKGNKEEYSKAKISLPAITFGATFQKHRATNDIKSYTSLLVLDIDDLDKEENVRMVENVLSKDKFVISCWRSPSNLGLKGLVYLEYQESFPLEQTAYFHQSAFVEVANYFKNTYGIILDESGKDVVRTCFVSHDNKLYYNKNFEKFQVSTVPTIKTNSKNRKIVISTFDLAVERDLLYNPKGKNKSQDRKIISQIIKFLRKRDLSITRAYNDWSNVARTIVCCFTFDIGLKYFQALSMQDIKIYEPEVCKRFLIERYLDTRTEFALATILFLANEKGYKDRGIDKNRRKIKGVIKYFAKEKLSIIASDRERIEIGKTIAQIFDYEIGIKYFKLLNKQNDNYNDFECENFLKELYLSEYEGYSIETILKIAKHKGYKSRDEVLKTANEPEGKGFVSINSLFEPNNV